jgi:hypothetical protein
MGFSTTQSFLSYVRGLGGEGVKRNLNFKFFGMEFVFVDFGLI